MTCKRTNRTGRGAALAMPWCLGFIVLIFSQLTFAQQNGDGQPPLSDAAVVSAAVILDGKELFRVRGISSYPATQRAKLIRNAIEGVADNPEISTDQIRHVDLDDRSSIYAGDTLILNLFAIDAELERLDRNLLAAAVTQRIAAAVDDYREDRSSPVLLRNTLFALGVTAAVLLLIWGLHRLFNWLDQWAVRHVQRNIEDLASKSHQLIQPGQVWALFAGLIRAIRFITIGVLIYFFLNTVLGLYPWTRSLAFFLFDLILDPLKSLWFGFVQSIPSLAFLVILFFVVRYLLKIARLFFRGIERGRIQLEKFDPDWAMPTYKIVRMVFLAFAVVIAYPYIPGSDSLAFKGVSLFLGVILSLGSSSYIANILAGLSMIYRGAFKEGDLVKIGDVVGRAVEVKLMVTRIQTARNESIAIPNSNILDTNVTNYTLMAQEQGVVIHVEIGIGYDTPWRQVEALLKMAAERTQGLASEPAPFVLQQSLGDYAINYQVNAYCRDDSRLLKIKSDLLSHIQDVFNEHGVQIMSPAYEADPESPKLVPPEQWYQAPAVKPQSDT